MEPRPTGVTQMISDFPVSLLDHFKSVNDTDGHGVGDKVLQRFAEVARRNVHSSDLISRTGGEEFAVVLPGASSGAAYIVADRVRVAFNESCRDLV